MTKRQITPQQLNKLFCSPDFIRRVEASGKPSTEVFLEATDEEVERWLAEGARIEQCIHMKVAGTASLRAKMDNSGKMEKQLKKPWWKLW